jgi:hypothetical protein
MPVQSNVAANANAAAPASDFNDAFLARLTVN